MVIGFDLDTDLDTLPLDDINLAELTLVHKNGQLWKLPLSSLSALVSTPARGHIDGLICSNAAGDLEHDISIAPGEARDSTNAYTLKLASDIVKQIDGGWGVGSGAGGLFSGASLSAGTPYYPFLIRKDSDGSIDAGFDDNVSGSHAPTGYTRKRRIMSLMTDASANIRNFYQIGDRVYLTSPVQDRAFAVLSNTSRNAHALSCPPSMLAMVICEAFHSVAAATFYLWVDSSLRADAAAASGNYLFHLYASTAPNSMECLIKTDSSRNIYSRGDSTNIQLALINRGWIDDRGRNAA
jgi:hypothetical protein